MANTQLPTFTTEGRFVAARPFLFRGQPFAKGDSVTGIPERKLEQFFRHRKVTYAGSTLTTPGAAGKKGK